MQVVYIKKLYHIKFEVKNIIFVSSMAENIRHHLTSIFFLQNRENCILKENNFWSGAWVLFKLQRRTIPHFKDNFIIKNFFPYHEAL